MHENGRIHAGHPHVQHHGPVRQLQHLPPLRLPQPPPTTAATTPTAATTAAAAAAAAATANRPSATEFPASVDSVFGHEHDAAAAAGHVLQRPGHQHGLPVDAIAAAVRPVASGQLRRIAAAADASAERSDVTHQVRQPSVATDIADAHRGHAGRCRPAEGHRIGLRIRLSGRYDDQLPQRASAVLPAAALSHSAALAAQRERAPSARGLSDSVAGIARSVEFGLAPLDLRLVRRNVQSAQSQHVLYTAFARC